MEDLSDEAIMSKRIYVDGYRRVPRYIIYELFDSIRLKTVTKLDVRIILCWLNNYNYKTRRDISPKFIYNNLSCRIQYCKYLKAFNRLGLYEKFREIDIDAGNYVRLPKILLMQLIQHGTISSICVALTLCLRTRKQYEFSGRFKLEYVSTKSGLTIKATSEGVQSLLKNNIIKRIYTNHDSHKMFGQIYKFTFVMTTEDIEAYRRKVLAERLAESGENKLDS